jgi:hypothetical protein
MHLKDRGVDQPTPLFLHDSVDDLTERFIGRKASFYQVIARQKMDSAVECSNAVIVVVIALIEF